MQIFGLPAGGSFGTFPRAEYRLFESFSSSCEAGKEGTQVLQCDWDPTKLGNALQPEDLQFAFCVFLFLIIPLMSYMRNMGYEISRREVLNNLIRFKDHLLEMRVERRESGLRKYNVLLNRKTGDMRFAQKIGTLEHHFSRKGGGKYEDWKQIQIVVHQGASFEITDENNHPIRPSELEPIAWRIASETLDILNQKARGVEVGPDQLPEEAILGDLSSIHLAQQRERIEDLPGWVGGLSRIDAEKLLDGKPAGTYVLRDGDELTISIAFHFSEENLLSVRAYLITVVEKEDKISDILLLQTEKGWTLYEDDPNLKDPFYRYYPSLLAILKKLEGMVKYPLSKGR